MKLLGAVMIFLACAMTGFWMARHYARRTEELRQLRGALSLLETEIAYGATPLYLACRHIGEQETGPVGRFFSLVSQNLTQSDGHSALECWQRALSEVKGELAIRERDRRILHRLGHKLGLSDKPDQIHHLRLAQVNLETEEAHAIKEQETYEKMFRSLGVLTGALLVILMY